MKREDFEAPPESKPGPPGQMELFEPGPGSAKAKAKAGAQRPGACPSGTLDLLGVLDSEE